jgi:branched-chain amino acid aminotransferase
MWLFFNDRVVDESEARVSVFDRGFMYGDGVFETLRVYRGRPFQLDEHLDRLGRSAALLRIRFGRSRRQIADDINRVIALNEITDGVVRVAVSRGIGRRGPSIEGTSKPTYVVSVGPLPEDLDRRRSRGVALSVVATRKVSRDALPAGVKHANYLNSILAHADAVETGADDALLLSATGEIAECSGANVFFVRGSRVETPPLSTGILPGCTRAHVLDLCRRAGITATERKLELPDLEGTEEAFLTNSVVEILPVRAIDGREFPVPGPMTSRLLGLYRNTVPAGSDG